MTQLTVKLVPVCGVEVSFVEFCKITFFKETQIFDGRHVRQFRRLSSSHCDVNNVVSLMSTNLISRKSDINVLKNNTERKCHGFGQAKLG